MTLVYAKKKKKFPYSYTLPCIYPLVNLIRFAYAKKKKKKKMVAFDCDFTARCIRAKFGFFSTSQTNTNRK